jgi:hypothetical protein
LANVGYEKIEIAVIVEIAPGTTARPFQILYNGAFRHPTSVFLGWIVDEQVADRPHASAAGHKQVECTSVVVVGPSQPNAHGSHDAKQITFNLREVTLPVVAEHDERRRRWSIPYAHRQIQVPVSVVVTPGAAHGVSAWSWDGAAYDLLHGTIAVVLVEEVRLPHAVAHH